MVWLTIIPKATCSSKLSVLTGSKWSACSASASAPCLTWWHKGAIPFFARVTREGKSTRFRPRKSWCFCFIMVGERASSVVWAMYFRVSEFLKNEDNHLYPSHLPRHIHVLIHICSGHNSKMPPHDPDHCIISSPWVWVVLVTCFRPTECGRGGRVPLPWLCWVLRPKSQGCAGVIKVPNRESILSGPAPFRWGLHSRSQRKSLLLSHWS